jgi:hypothetical protein
MDRKAIGLTSLLIGVGMAWRMQTSEVAPERAMDQPTESEVGNGAADKLAELERAVGKLRQSQAQLSTKVDELPTAAGNPAELSGGTQGESFDETPPAEADLTPRERLNLQTQLLDERLEEEREDPRWSQAAAQDLGAIVAELASSGVVLQDAECRTSMCRLRVRLGEGDASLDLGRSLSAAVDWPAPRFIYVDGDRDHVAVAYFAREGHTLPRR